MKKLGTLGGLLMLACTAAMATTVNLNDTVTAIYGTGNPDNGWITSTASGGTTLGLNADFRNTGVVPNNGDGSYSFPTGFDPAHPTTRAIWNYAFSVNNPQGLLGSSYWLSITGPGVNTTFNLAVIGDNAYGTSSTPNGGGTVGTYSSVAGATVMQNSENIIFLGADPNAAGDYNFRLFETVPSGSFTLPPDRILNEVDATVHVGSVPDSGSTLTLSAMAIVPLLLVRKFNRHSKPADVHI